ncbi:MAG: helix-turn-helix domain-containing protein [Steroidobacteraceae bacterium]
MIHLRTGGSEMERLLTADDVRDRLRVSRGSAYRVVHALPNVRIGKSIRIRESVLEKAIDEGSIDLHETPEARDCT